MNPIALSAGIIIALAILIRFKQRGLEKMRWVYPLLLATFPLYYFGFALYALDLEAFFYEVLIGLLFFAIAYFAYTGNHYHRL